MAAKENLESALELQSQQLFRSAGSRAYYAAHNACQGIVTHLEPDAMTGRWASLSHERLPGQTRHSLGRIGKYKQLRELLWEDLKASCRVRIAADYRPQEQVECRMISRSMRTARQSIGVLEQLLK